MITREMVMDALQENMSTEFEDGNIVYYLHVTEDGKIVDSFDKADESFTAILDKEAYSNFPEDYDWRADVEVEGNRHFEEVVDNLYEQVQEYFA